VNFVTAAVLMDLTIRIEPFMVPLITLNTFLCTLVAAESPVVS